MLVRIGLRKKKADWTTAEFRAHWVSHHGPLAKQLSGPRGYVQNHVVGSAPLSDFARGPEEFDGFSQLWFDDEAAMRAAVATDLGRALAADESHFIGDLRIALVRQREFIKPPTDESTIKLIGLARRRADITPDLFEQRWNDSECRPFAALAGIRGARQSLVVGREVPKGVPAAYEHLPIDGFLELWLNGVAASSSFSTLDGVKMLGDNEDCISELTSYYVEPVIVI